MRRRHPPTHWYFDCQRADSGGSFSKHLTSDPLLLCPAYSPICYCSAASMVTSLKASAGYSSLLSCLGKFCIVIINSPFHLPCHR